MTTFRNIFATLIISSHVALAHAQCVKPDIKIFKGSCKALHSTDQSKSEHVGDIWMTCEEMSGTHGTAGSGMAIFLAKEARPYWHSHIKESINIGKRLLSRTEYKSLVNQQKSWEKSLDRKIKNALQDTDGEGGTLALYIGEAKATEIVRIRALEVGCKLEKIAP